MKKCATSTFIIFLFCFRTAFACGTFGALGNDNNPTSAEEEALIIWDSKNETEHFIRQAKFDTQLNNFAYIVPVPSTPNLEEAPADLLTRVKDKFFWSLPKSKPQLTGFIGAAGNVATPGPVEVVKQQIVAGMDASVVRSTDAEALQKWLNSNGYNIQKTALPWIQHYVEQKWEFVAFKIKSSTLNQNEKLAKITNRKKVSPQKLIASPLVRISFKTPRPIYPYREPASFGQGFGEPRQLQLFVIAPHPIVASTESINPWKNSSSLSVESTFNAPFESGKSALMKSLDSYLSLILGRSLNSEKMFITKFDISERYREQNEDLYFDPKLLKEKYESK